MGANGAKEPETLDSYRQTATWMVSLATGALAAGLLIRDDIGTASNWVKIAIILAGVCFFTTILTGVFLTFWSLQYDGAIRNKQGLEDKQASADGSSTPSLAEKLEKKEAKIKEAKREISRYHGAVLFSFPAGAFFAAMGVFGLIMTSPKVPGKFSVVSVARSSTAGIGHSPTTLLLSETDGRTWELIANENRDRFWRCIPRHPVVEADSCAGSIPDSIHKPPQGIPVKKDNQPDTATY